MNFYERVFKRTKDLRIRFLRFIGKRFYLFVIFVIVFLDYVSWFNLFFNFKLRLYPKSDIYDDIFYILFRVKRHLIEIKCRFAGITLIYSNWNKVHLFHYFYKSYLKTHTRYVKCNTDNKNVNSICYINVIKKSLNICLIPHCVIIWNFMKASLKELNI